MTFLIYDFSDVYDFLVWNASVVVGDLDAVCVTLGPHEADSPFFVYSDRVLPLTVVL